jgi:hypothetical protein
MRACSAWINHGAATAFAGGCIACTLRAVGLGSSGGSVATTSTRFTRGPWAASSQRSTCSATTAAIGSTLAASASTVVPGSCPQPILCRVKPEGAWSLKLRHRQSLWIISLHLTLPPTLPPRYVLKPLELRTGDLAALEQAVTRPKAALAAAATAHRSTSSPALPLSSSSSASASLSPPPPLALPSAGGGVGGGRPLWYVHSRHTRTCSRRATVL